MKTLIAGIAIWLMAAFAMAEDARLRGAVLEIGTVNWELTTIRNREFDKAEGYELAITPFADNGATRIALEGGEADFAVADWVWVVAQNAAGKDYVFLPYSRAVGGLVVAGDSPIKALPDLAGKKVGIAGGPVDKSWLILQAYALKEHGFDLKANTEQVFGAPPIIMKAGLSGDNEGTINFWHFLAKMRAAGMRELISVEKAAGGLGLDPDVPLLGYVFKREFAEANPDIVMGFARSSWAAKELLRADDAAWEEIREMMNAANDEQYEELKTLWRAGIPIKGPVNEKSAADMFDLMRELGGEKLVGKATNLPEGIFLDYWSE